ncbi:MAG TPA: hypothetical protein VNL36_08755 [Bacteroidota bacterium]|nr:hypothetical protein [Bacteroidota bacterium]
MLQTRLFPLFLSLYFAGGWQEVYGIDEPLSLRLSKFVTLYPEYHQPPTYPTIAVVATRDDTLYISVEASFNPALKPIAQGLQRDGSTGQDDMIWIVIDPDRRGKDGYLFGVNSINTQYDFKITNVSQISLEWNYQWKSFTRVDSSAWMGEFWIPLSGLLRASVDSLGINILRGPYRRTEGSIEVVSLIPLPPGIPTTSVQFTQAIPVSFRIPSTHVHGYFLPYLRSERIRSVGSDWKASTGFETRLHAGSHSMMATYKPDFSAAGASSFSLDIISNRFYVAENRYFFTESEKFTRLPLNSFYSKLISDDVRWGIQYGFEREATKVFIMSLRSPLVNNIFTGEPAKTVHWYSMIAGAHSAGYTQVQLNISQLTDRMTLTGGDPLVDLQLLYAPSWTLKSHFSYDVKDRSSALDVQFSSLSTVGPSIVASASYIARAYQYPLAFLEFGNNNWKTSGRAQYVWTFKRNVASSLGLNAGWLLLERLSPASSLIRLGIVGGSVEIVPLTHLFYSFTYDERPSIGQTNLYHAVSIQSQYQEFLQLQATAQRGVSGGKQLQFYRVGFTLNPFSQIRLEANYTARKLDASTDEFYTAIATTRLLTDVFLRVYYQSFSLPSQNTSGDVLNGLLNYYLSRRNNLYLLVNLRNNLKTMDTMARLGYEISI